MTLRPNHNHPVVFRKHQGSWDRVRKPAEMSEQTRRRVHLQRLCISEPRLPTQTTEQYATLLAGKVGMSPKDAKRFLYGVLDKRSNQDALQGEENREELL